MAAPKHLDRRKVLLLVDAGQLSQRAAARALGCSQPNIAYHVRMRRAKVDETFAGAATDDRVRNRGRSS